MINELPDLHLTAGNTVQLVGTITSEGLSATSVEANIVSSNLNVITPLTSVISGANKIVTITIPSTVTMAARSKGTILEIKWTFSANHIENTRVNLVGVI